MYCTHLRDSSCLAISSPVEDSCIEWHSLTHTSHSHIPIHLTLTPHSLTPQHTSLTPQHTLLTHIPHTHVLTYYIYSHTHTPPSPPYTHTYSHTGLWVPNSLLSENQELSWVPLTVIATPQSGGLWNEPSPQKKLYSQESFSLSPPEAAPNWRGGAMGVAKLHHTTVHYKQIIQWCALFRKKEILYWIVYTCLAFSLPYPSTAGSAHIVIWLFLYTNIHNLLNQFINELNYLIRHTWTHRKYINMATHFLQLWL